ncbi:MAG: hypothetical protein N2047_08565 [Meiothermus sp.]|nr:hypothetical protein [Meiothermus sp.]
MSNPLKELFGTLRDSFQIGLAAATAALLKTAAGRLDFRNRADSAHIDIRVKALQLNDGDTNQITLQSPPIAADYTLTLPAAQGAANQVLAQGSTPGELVWANVAVATDTVKTDTTTVAHNSAGTVPMFALPANARVLRVRLIIDTPFTGGSGAQVSVGIAGNVAKYMAATENDLSYPALTSFEVEPNLTPVGTVENLVATYAANGATAGAARIEVDYVLPG